MRRRSGPGRPATLATQAEDPPPAGRTRPERFAARGDLESAEASQVRAGGGRKGEGGSGPARFGPTPARVFVRPPVHAAEIEVLPCPRDVSPSGRNRRPPARP